MNEDMDSGRREIDAVLARATAPVVPDGAHARLLARLAQSAARPNVVPFAPPHRRSGNWRVWPAMVALAASFAFGIYLGADGTADGLWPVASDDAASVIGLGEAGDFLDGDAT